MSSLKFSSASACTSSFVSGRIIDQLTGEITQAPPVSNRGAQTPFIDANTLPIKQDLPESGVYGLIDWLQVTFLTIETPSDPSIGAAIITDWLGGDWLPASCGLYGYKQGLVCGQCTVLYDGRVPGMGVHLQCTGQGCRQLEGSGAVTEWGKFLQTIFDMGGKFTRLDTAIDDRRGLVKLEDVQAAIAARTVVTRWNKARLLHEVDLHGDGPCDESSDGKTVYFGKQGASDVTCRMYNKAAQLCVEGHWTRVELECRRERAQGMAAAIIEHGLTAMTSVLKGYIDFKVKSSDSHRERWATCSWWAAFLGWADRAVMALLPVVRTVEKAAQWVLKSVAPTIAVLWEVAGLKGDPFDEESQGRNFRLMFDRFVANGLGRYRTSHKRMISDYQTFVCR